MTTSGSFNFNPTVQEIVYGAMRLIGATASGETASASDMTDAIEAMNYMVKDWQNDGIGLWLNQEVTLFHSLNSNSYNLGPTGDHATTSHGKTEVKTAAVATDTTIVVDSISDFGDTYDIDGIITAVTPAGAGSITLDGTLVSGTTATLPSVREILIYSDGDDSGVTFSITGTNALEQAQTETITGPNTTTVYSTKEYRTITAVTISAAGTGNITIGCVGDFAGIELDDGTLQWTNIGGALAATLVLVDALTDGVAIDNHVYSYSSKIQRPYEIIEYRRIDASGLETVIDIIGRDEYMALNLKTNTGITNQVWYDPQLINGRLNIWPASGDVQDTAGFTMKYPLTDFDDISDTADFPPNALKALKWNLAVDLAPENGRSVPEAVFMEAMRTKASLIGFDREDTSTYFGMDYSG